MQAGGAVLEAPALVEEIVGLLVEDFLHHSACPCAPHVGSLPRAPNMRLECQFHLLASQIACFGEDEGWLEQGVRILVWDRGAVGCRQPLKR